MSIRSSIAISTKLSVTILRLIPKYPQTITAQQITDELAQYNIVRDKRNIQNILNALCEELTELECNNSKKPYLYCWRANAKGFNLPFITTQESLLLMLAQHQLEPLLPETLKRTLQQWIKRANSYLETNKEINPATETAKYHKDEAQKALAWMSKVQVVSQTQPLLAAHITEGVLDTVTTALYNNYYLIVDYTNAGGEQKKSKRIMPLGLAQQGYSLYLICVFDGYTEPRTLALHRIKYAWNTNIGFEIPNDFSLEQYHLDGNFAFGHGRKIKLILKVNVWLANLLTETKLSKDQEINEVDEDTREVIATVVDTLQLDWWLKSWEMSIYSIKKE